jgi:tRNA-dihydrouridine synthase A
MNASTLSLAPMMDYTDVHFRHLVRLISSRTLLYTEMVAANAICHERSASMQDYADMHHVNVADPVVRANYDDAYLQRYLAQGVVESLEGASVLQFGGSDPEQLFAAAQAVVDLSRRGRCEFTAINLNCGCPSPKVAGKGCFGAALMDDPKLVADLTKAIHDGCDGSLPVTVKCRIGTDSLQPFTQMAYATMDPDVEYARLRQFIETVASNGIVTDFSVHARIAVLTKNLSPAANRKIPPLKYELVRRLVKDYPEFTFSLNGGVNSLPQAIRQLDACPGLRGIMIGRGWAADPWAFAMADKLLYGVNTIPRNRLQVLEEYGKHADYEESIRDPLKIRRWIIKAVSPLFAGEANAKKFRVDLDQIAGMPKQLHREGKKLSSQPKISELIMNAAIRHLSDESLLRSPEESYERVMFEDSNTCTDTGSMPQSVSDWQDRRKKGETNAIAGDYCS